MDLRLAHPIVRLLASASGLVEVAEPTNASCVSGPMHFAPSSGRRGPIRLDVINKSLDGLCIQACVSMLAWRFVLFDVVFQVGF